jgi:DNA-binding NtrC family response regulator
MSGSETYQELRRRWPGLPLVLCSGYDQGATASRFAGDPLTTFLQKPYTPRGLLEKLGEILEA